MKTLPLFAIAPAQIANEGLANTIIAARQKNAQFMQQYSWNSHIEILAGGTVKDTASHRTTKIKKPPTV